MSAPVISVALATYNGERFLKEQLGSIAVQTLQPYELVVRDDCSADNTLGILRAFAAEVSFSVRISVNDVNLGPGETFLLAASDCRGDWIAFCDQDDVWMAGKLERVAEVIARRDGVGMVSHSALQVGEHLETLPGVPRHPDFRRLSAAGPLRNPPMRSHPGFSCVFRRSLFGAVPFAIRPRHKMHPDRLEPHDNFVYNLANTYGSIVRLPEALALHRRHGNTVTGAAGTGIKTGFARERWASRGEKHGRKLLALADLARSHRAFYERILAEYCPGPDSDFERRTRNAVAYYGALERGYLERAAIYDAGAGLGKRFAALGRCLASRAYMDHAGGRGMGVSALARDLAETVSLW